MIFSVFCHTFAPVKAKNSRACGEIGRRARLRIWCFATCRFESYHAHDWTKEEFSKKESSSFFENRQCEQQKVTRSTAECGAAWVAKSECCQFYYQNRQCRQRLVKRRTGEARTVWAAIRRRCQFKESSSFFIFTYTNTFTLYFSLPL